MSLTIQKQRDREFILECIRLYRELPALWKIRSDDYRDRNKKKESYDILLRKYREKFPEANKDDLKKKFNSLRTNFRKELRKVWSSGFEEMYEPSLWYFDEMLFLQDQEETPMMFNNAVENVDVVVDDEDDDDDDIISEVNSSSSDSKRLIISPSISHDQKVQRPEKRRKREDQRPEHDNDHRDELISLAFRQLCQAEDEHFQIAKVWATELSRMDKKQQVFAKKYINDILFEGQMGALDRHSVHINTFIKKSNSP